MKKRLLSIALIAVMLFALFALAGCGGDKECAEDGCTNAVVEGTDYCEEHTPDDADGDEGGDDA